MDFGSLVFFNDSGKDKIYLLPSGRTNIGSTKECQIRIKKISVEPIHATIECNENGSVILHRKCTLDGILSVNKVPVKTCVILRNSDRIEIGTKEIIYNCDHKIKTEDISSDKMLTELNSDDNSKMRSPRLNKTRFSLNPNIKLRSSMEKQTSNQVLRLSGTIPETGQAKRYSGNLSDLEGFKTPRKDEASNAGNISKKNYLQNILEEDTDVNIPDMETKKRSSVLSYQSLAKNVSPFLLQNKDLPKSFLSRRSVKLLESSFDDSNNDDDILKLNRSGQRRKSALESSGELFNQNINRRITRSHSLSSASTNTNICSAKFSDTPSSSKENCSELDFPTVDHDITESDLNSSKTSKTSLSLYKKLSLLRRSGRFSSNRSLNINKSPMKQKLTRKSDVAYMLTSSIKSNKRSKSMIDKVTTDDLDIENESAKEGFFENFVFSSSDKNTSDVVFSNLSDNESSFELIDPSIKDIGQKDFSELNSTFDGEKPENTSTIANCNTEKNTTDINTTNSVLTRKTTRSYSLSSMSTRSSINESSRKRNAKSFISFNNSQKNKSIHLTKFPNQEVIVESMEKGHINSEISINKSLTGDEKSSIQNESMKELKNNISSRKSKFSTRRSFSKISHNSSPLAKRSKSLGHQKSLVDFRKSLAQNSTSNSVRRSTRERSKSINYYRLSKGLDSLNSPTSKTTSTTISNLNNDQYSFISNDSELVSDVFQDSIDSTTKNLANSSENHSSYKSFNSSGTEHSEGKNMDKSTNQSLTEESLYASEKSSDLLDSPIKNVTNTTENSMQNTNNIDYHSDEETITSNPPSKIRSSLRSSLLYKNDSLALKTPNKSTKSVSHSKEESVNEMVSSVKDISSSQIKKSLRNSLKSSFVTHSLNKSKNTSVLESNDRSRLLVSSSRKSMENQLTNENDDFNLSPLYINDDSTSDSKNLSFNMSSKSRKSLRESSKNDSKSVKNITNQNSFLSEKSQRMSTSIKINKTNQGDPSLTEQESEAFTNLADEEKSQEICDSDLTKSNSNVLSKSTDEFKSKPSRRSMVRGSQSLHENIVVNKRQRRSINFKTMSKSGLVASTPKETVYSRNLKRLTSTNATNLQKQLNTSDKDISSQNQKSFKNVSRKKRSNVSEIFSSAGTGQIKKKPRMDKNFNKSDVDRGANLANASLIEIKTVRRSFRTPKKIQREDFIEYWKSSSSKESDSQQGNKKKDVPNTKQKNIQKIPCVTKPQKSPRNDLSDLRGVKKMFSTPKIQNPPLNDLTKIQGLRKIFSPIINKSPKNDLTDVRGVKKLLKTPKVHKSPKNGLSDVRGVKRLLKTPKVQKSPKNDLTDIRGVKKLLKTPKVQKSPKNDLTDIRGVKKLLKTPKVQKSPKNDLTDIRGVKKLLKTPKVQKSPKNDLTDIRGVKKLLKTPKVQKSPKNELSNFKGVKELLASPKIHRSPKNDLTNVCDLRPLFKTEKNRRNVSFTGLDLLFKEDAFDKLIGKRPIKTYSPSPRKSNEVLYNTNIEVDERVADWVEEQTKLNHSDTNTKNSVTSKTRGRKKTETIDDKVIIEINNVQNDNSKPSSSQNQEETHIENIIKDAMNLSPSPVKTRTTRNKRTAKESKDNDFAINLPTKRTRSKKENTEVLEHIVGKDSKKSIEVENTRTVQTKTRNKNKDTQQDILSNVARKSVEEGKKDIKNVRTLRSRNKIEYFEAQENLTSNDEKNSTEEELSQVKNVRAIRTRNKKSKEDIVDQQDITSDDGNKSMEKENEDVKNTRTKKTKSNNKIKKIDQQDILGESIEKKIENVRTPRTRNKNTRAQPDVNDDTKSMEENKYIKNVRTARTRNKKENNEAQQNITSNDDESNDIEQTRTRNKNKKTQQEVLSNDTRKSVEEEKKDIKNVRTVRTRNKKENKEVQQNMTSNDDESNDIEQSKTRNKNKETQQDVLSNDTRKSVEEEKKDLKNVRTVRTRNKKENIEAQQNSTSNDEKNMEEELLPQVKNVKATRTKTKSKKENTENQVVVRATRSKKNNTENLESHQSVLSHDESKKNIQEIVNEPDTQIETQSKTKRATNKRKLNSNTETSFVESPKMSPVKRLRSKTTKNLNKSGDDLNAILSSTPIEKNKKMTRGLKKLTKVDDSDNLSLQNVSDRQLRVKKQKKDLETYVEATVELQKRTRRRN